MNYGTAYYGPSITQGTACGTNGWEILGYQPTIQITKPKRICEYCKGITDERSCPSCGAPEQEHRHQHRRRAA